MTLAAVKNSPCDTDTSRSATEAVTASIDEDKGLKEKKKDSLVTTESDSKGLLSYTSPLDHLRNING